MEDLFDKARDRWQRHFRYPLVLRLLFLAGVLIAVGILLVASDRPAWTLLDKVRDVVRATSRRSYVALGAAILAAAWCVWVSFKSWATHVICSPTSLKMSVLFHGRRRISWDNIREVHYTWRLLGHTLTFYGSDGARVAFRSSIGDYDDILTLVRDLAPDHINTQLDEFIGEEEEEEEEEDEEQAADQEGPQDHATEPPQPPPQPDVAPEDTASDEASSDGDD